MLSSFLGHLSSSRSGGGGLAARCLASGARSSSTAAAAAADTNAGPSIRRDAPNSNRRTIRNHGRRPPPQTRRASKYAAVDHSHAYRRAMDAAHGQQLLLALEEGRGQDDAPFDPFSQFLDEMGTPDQSVVVEGDEEEYEEQMNAEDIDEAEFVDIEDQEADAALEDDDAVLEEDDEADDDEADDEAIYTSTGALYRPKSERRALRAGYPAGGSFAVVQLAGFQHKVTVDDLLVVNKLKPVSEWSVGSLHTFEDDDVLLVANTDETLVGLPGVKGARVDVMVEEITRDKTLVIFKKRRRKHSKRKNGFRRQVTFLRVLDVRMPGEQHSTDEITDEPGHEEEAHSMAA